MGEYTLFKLQVDDATFTAHAPFSKAGSESASDEETGTVASGGSDGDGGSRLLALLIGLVFLVVVAALVRKLRGGAEPE